MDQILLKVSIGNYSLQLVHTTPTRDEVEFVIGKQFPLGLYESRPFQEGFVAQYKLHDDKGITLTLAGKSKHGNPVDFANEVFTANSSDPAILEVTQEGGTITVKPVGPIGSAQVQVTIPGIQVGNPPAPISGHFDIDVVAGDVASIQFTPGDTFDLPDVAAPAGGTDLGPNDTGSAQG